MIKMTSVLADLLQAMPQLQPQVYFKSSLIALSHAIEDQVLAGSTQPLVIACFQKERFYLQEIHRYQRIAEKTSQVYLLAAPEKDFQNSSDGYETIALRPEDGLSEEWNLVVIGQNYANCLICREEAVPSLKNTDSEEGDQSRRFEGIWSFDQEICKQAAELILNRIAAYRPELAAKISEAKSQFLEDSSLQSFELNQGSVNTEAFVQRLVNYLQAGQYKLLKAYRSIAAQEQKERLVNSITSAIRRSLNPEEFLAVAVQELGQALGLSRCMIYRCKATDWQATINHEFLRTDEARLTSLRGQTWPLREICLFREVVERQEPVFVEDTQADSRINNSNLNNLVQQFAIRSWLILPVLYQSRLLGMIELHHCGDKPLRWHRSELAMLEAIATQVGVSLMQAEAYAHLEELNQQLAALDRTRSNLIAITGHELRTPLSTIQVCLESLASEPNMSLELRQVMLNTALGDAERLRKLVQDFLTLSRLEGGNVKWYPEPLSLQECIDFALSNIYAHRPESERPSITTQIPKNLPLVRADGEWFVEILTKLLDNACKFTEPQGQITLKIQSRGSSMLEVTVTDTGRGIEPNRLEAVFDRFYQEEGALRRTAGGTGLGLAICRQIVKGWGGQIWADSAGKNQGSQFHFTVPIISQSSTSKPSTTKGKDPTSDLQGSSTSGGLFG